MTYVARVVSTLWARIEKVSATLPMLARLAVPRTDFEEAMLP